MNEHIIQEQIVKYCKANKYLVLSIPNEGQRTFANLNYLLEMGLYPGASDLIVGFNGKIFFVEVKNETGKQTKNQKKFQKEVESYGFTYVLVRSLEDFKIMVEKLKRTC